MPLISFGAPHSSHLPAASFGLFGQLGLWTISWLKGETRVLLQAGHSGIVTSSRRSYGAACRHGSGEYAGTSHRLSVRRRPRAMGKIRSRAAARSAVTGSACGRFALAMAASHGTRDTDIVAVSIPRPAWRGW